MTADYQPIWHEGRLAAADTETTGVGPDSRIVTACVMLPGQQPQTWLLDPGIDIPADAAAVHGITTERARAEGMDYRAGVQEIADALDLASSGRGLVFYNAAFDLSLLVRECHRLQIPFTVPEWIVDPFVIDKGVDPYRRGKRQLVVTAQRYGIDLLDAHTADADARAAGNLTRAMAAQARAQSGPCAALHGLTFDQLMAWQKTARQRQMDSLRAYFDRNGTVHDGCDPGWPVTNTVLAVVA